MINLKKNAKISCFLLLRFNKNLLNLFCNIPKDIEKNSQSKNFMVKNKNNVFSCKNQKLGLKKSSKGEGG